MLTELRKVHPSSTTQKYEFTHHDAWIEKYQDAEVTAAIYWVVAIFIVEFAVGRHAIWFAKTIPQIWSWKISHLLS